jgi:hypothetical protein
MGISGPERTGAKAAETKALAWLAARVVWHREHHSSAAPRTRVDRYRSPVGAVGGRARSPPGQLPTTRVSAFTHRSGLVKVASAMCVIGMSSADSSTTCARRGSRPTRRIIRNSRLPFWR